MDSHSDASGTKTSKSTVPATPANTPQGSSPNASNNDLPSPISPLQLPPPAWPQPTQPVSDSHLAPAGTSSSHAPPSLTQAAESQAQGENATAPTNGVPSAPAPGEDQARGRPQQRRVSIVLPCRHRSEGVRRGRGRVRAPSPYPRPRQVGPSNNGNNFAGQQDVSCCTSTRCNCCDRSTLCNYGYKPTECNCRCRRARYEEEEEERPPVSMQTLAAIYKGRLYSPAGICSWLKGVGKGI
ncbi:uncharacterized protein GGS25DRAFT_522480 [Hypoxylon fragiforme]|uniref:uncharacterized protein n=1 Tax=Hypoxylon fragiforme TaxID=63214 RepID=UPI0020C5EF37|nr:uncharacterized protein GGS25DRAFT_522480 [Hypoxylon fragiforme]KAI2606964.1 hypothetical protein GGS25DRAFT_522480 [Hypoxylon fragiforme]